MDQPGQGSRTPKIVDDPSLRSPLRKYVEGSATVALWIAWAYFIAPVMTLVFWAFGVHLIYEAFFPKHGLWELSQVLRRAGVTLVVIFTLDILWIFYNLRYASKRPKNTKKYGEVPPDSARLVPMGKNNRIELSLEEANPRVVSLSYLEKEPAP